VTERPEAIVPIASCAGSLEGEMWLEALRREGIPAMLRSRALGALPSDHVYICVLENDVADALALLEQLGLRPEDRLP
jgi:hypothetical protein